MRIIFRPLLVPGVFGTMEQAEDAIRQEIEAMAALGIRPVILIDSEQPDREKLVSLWHEVLHMIIFARDPTAPHDEAWIEATAQKMADVAPDLLDKMGDLNG